MTLHNTIENNDSNNMRRAKFLQILGIAAATLGLPTVLFRNDVLAMAAANPDKLDDPEEDEENFKMHVAVVRALTHNRPERFEDVKVEPFLYWK